MRTSQTNWKALRRPARQKTQPFLVYDSENMHRQYTIIVAPFTARKERGSLNISPYITGNHEMT